MSNDPTRDGPEEERRLFWAERSHSDAKSLNDHARAAAQTVLLVNGGAITALLAFAPKNGGPSFFQNLLMFTGLIFYVCGVIAGA